MKKLFLIRHGETKYTAEKRYCGHRTVPLNAQGRKQARQLGERLKNEPIDIVYSSDLKRAAHTAGIAFPERAIHKKRKLREIDFGDFAGHTWEDISRIYPGIYDKWLNNPGDTEIPGGESIREFAKRIESCFNEIYRQSQNKQVAIVTHGGVTRVILMKLLRYGFDRFWTIEQDTACLNIVEFDSDAPKVIAINDRSYLTENDK